MAALIGELKQIATKTLDIGYFENGPADGPVAVLMHGFPYDAHAYADVVPKLNAEGFRTIAPFMRGYGPTRFRETAAMRSGEQAAFGADLLALMDALGVERAILGGYDWGGRAACVVSALWPDRVIGLVTCQGAYNIQDIGMSATPSDPAQEHKYWYQYYFNTERGRRGLTEKRAEISRYIWRIWSPHWPFSDADFQRSAASFDNPDFVEVVLHSYRHRFGNVPGDPAYADIEKRLAHQPEISVPTICVAGDDDGVEAPSAPEKLRKHFTGPFEYRLEKGIGHNLPQEAPEVFARAILDVTRLSA